MTQNLRQWSKEVLVNVETFKWQRDEEYFSQNVAIR